MRLRYFNVDGEATKEGHSHVYIDPGNGALYCISSAYQHAVEAAGYKFVRLVNRYSKIRALLEKGKAKEAERVFYTALITGELE